MLKKLLIFSLIFGTPLFAHGAVSFELLSEKNNLEIRGVCTTEVKVELYEGTNFEADPLYLSTIPCINDAFTVSDDLTRWSIPEGNYKLVVDGERATIQDFTIKAEVMSTEEKVNRELLAKGLPGEMALSADQVFENAQAGFSEKLYALQLDLITMKTALADTSYPGFIKVGLGGALGTVESALGKLNEAFFVVEKRDFVEPMPTTFENPSTPTETEIEVNEVKEEPVVLPTEEVSAEVTPPIELVPETEDASPTLPVE